VRGCRADLGVDLAHALSAHPREARRGEGALRLLTNKLDRQLADPPARRRAAGLLHCRRTPCAAEPGPGPGPVMDKDHALGRDNDFRESNPPGIDGQRCLDVRAMFSQSVGISSWFNRWT
jgi:hypothetical protein